MRVDQCHSSLVFTHLTGWHCKFRPNTGGNASAADKRHDLLMKILVGVGGVMALLPFLTVFSCVKRQQQKKAGVALIMGNIPIPGGFAEPDSDDEALLVIEPVVC
jgi:hypothetical protein